MGKKLLKINHKKNNMTDTQTQTKTKTSVKVELAIAGGIVLLMAMAGGVYIKQNANYVRYSDNLPETILTSDTTIPINVEGTIKSLFLSGKVELKGENSLIRAILTDSGNKEYLVYETYPLIARKTIFSVDRACDETCILPDIKPKELRIQINNAELDISDTVYYTTEQPGGILKDKRTPEQARQDSIKKKIDALNKEIKAKGMDWVAGETSVSGLTYEQKKHLFHTPDGTMVTEVPNLQGFEYYKGGVFEYRTNENFEKKNKTPNNGALINNILEQFEKLNFIQQAKTALAAIISNSDIPDKWDWRNVHGENWLTPVKDQGFVDTCLAFASVGAFEAQINLYYNQHINPDLSEQQVIDCLFEAPTGYQKDLYDTLPQCDEIKKANIDEFIYCRTKYKGITHESMDPYVQRTTPGSCNYLNLKYGYEYKTWKNSDFMGYLLGSNLSDVANYSKREIIANEDGLKKILISKGPLVNGIPSWVHTMALVGYENDPDGTLWIFKNSWGPNWGENGYGKLRILFNDLSTSATLPLGPFIPPSMKVYWPANFDEKINCVDKDDDGYCNWGISPNKPSTCATSCEPEKDYDDDNSNINIKPTPNPLPSITVLSPNGGEKWAPGSTQKITWTSSNVAQVGLDLTLVDGTPVVMNLVNVQGNPGTATWTIPNNIPYKQYKLRVSGCSRFHSAGNCAVQSLISDVSDAPFTIAPELEKYFKYNYYGTYSSYVPPLPGGTKKCSCDTSASSFDCVTGSLVNTCNKKPGTRYDQCTFTSVNSSEKNNKFCYDQSDKNYYIFMQTAIGSRLK